MNKLCIKLIESYQKHTKNVNHRCRFYPSCSNYGLECYKRFNFFKASFLTFYRIIRCNPWNKGGYDPVPEKKAKLMKVHDNVFYLEHRLNTDRPNIGYILTNGFGIMIDAGTSKKHVKSFLKALKHNNLPLPKYTILTHYHWDHSFGLKYVKTTKIGLTKTNDKLLYLKDKLERTNLNKLIKDKDIEPFSSFHIRYEYKHKKIKIDLLDITFDNIFFVENIKLLEFPSNHTNDTLIIFDESNKVLFLGDALCGKIIDYDFIIDEKILEKQINYLESLDFDIAIESHNNPVSKDELIKSLRQK